MSTGASKDLPPPAEEGGGSSKFPAKSPTDGGSTSAPSVDSGRKRLESPSKAADSPVTSTPNKSVGLTLLLPNTTISTTRAPPESSSVVDTSGPADLQFGESAESTKPLPENITGPAQNFGDKNAQIGKLSLHDTTQAAWNDEDSLNGRHAADLKRESEVKMPPVGNKTHLNARKHVSSSKENFREKTWACEKEFILSGLDNLDIGPYPIPVNIEELIGHEYSAHRKIRGDGDGFYRAFMFAYMENILESKDISELARLKERIKECKITMEKLNYGFDSSTFDDTLEKINSLISGTDVSISSTDLMRRACVPDQSDSMVKFLRYVTASEIRLRFSSDPESGNEFVQNWETRVLPLGADEGEEFHTMALCSALGVPIHVLYLDRCWEYVDDYFRIYGVFRMERTFYINSREDHLDQIQPRLTLMFRPGQFEILYPKGNAAPWACEKEPFSSGLRDSETARSLIPLNIEHVGHQYSAYREYREIRGDGDGMYRTFMFAYMEQILESKDIAELARFKEIIKKRMVEVGWMGYKCDSSAFDDTIKKMNSLISGTDVSISSSDLMRRVCVPYQSHSMVKFMRCLTAYVMRRRLGDYQIEYCDQKVLPLGVEGDDSDIAFLCAGLVVPIRVIHLDSKVPERFYKSSLRSGGEIEVPRFTLAFRPPGQFYILY